MGPVRPWSTRPSGRWSCSLSQAASGDDPGAGGEPDTVLAPARVERSAPPFDRALRGGGIRPLEYVAGAREAADPVEGRGNVRTVVDGLMDVGEGDAGEARRLQDLLHGRLIGERERIRFPGRDGHRLLRWSE